MRSLLCLAASALPVAAFADVTPLSERLESDGQPLYDGLGQANHVYGYRFSVEAPGSIEALGGRFAGAKSVALLDADLAPLGSIRIAGSSDTWRYAELDAPVVLTPGAEYTVAVRTGTAGSTSAAWSVPMPFGTDGVSVLGAVQGWSAATDVTTWAATIAPLGESLARGLVDVRFVADDGSGDGDDSGDGGDDTVPPTEPPVEPPPVAGDPYPGTPGVIDSFGDATAPAARGMGFMAVAAYYRDFPRRSGECAREVHDRWWTLGPDGRAHPSWHPPVDPVSGCTFAHEHGSDPRTSPNYAFAGGVPFGYVHGGAGMGGQRREDHVGHKVVVQNGYGVVSGNPQDGTQPGTSPIVRTGVTCDWLSKIHQGSHSDDALGDNAHEYYLNLRCDDGLDLRLKYLLTFGPPGLVTSSCKSGTSQAFDAGVPAKAGVPVVNPLDGKREYGCIDDIVGTDKTGLEELWKGDGVVQLPGGGYINYSPYYVVLNPARYMDHRYAERGAPDAYISSVDLCFDDSPPWRGQAPRFCADVPTDFRAMDSAARQRDPRNPMNGTRRVLHPKEMIVLSTNEGGSEPDFRFCTDRLGRNARGPEAGSACAADEIEQRVSRTDRRNYGWRGSDVNAITVAGQLRGAGFLAEWPLDFRARGVRFPN